MATGRECDMCHGTEYTAENPRVFGCQRRPSDPSEMCAVIAGHASCVGAGKTKLPSMAPEGGFASAEDWGRWIEGPEANAAGICFLSLGP